MNFGHCARIIFLIAIVVCRFLAYRVYRLFGESTVGDVATKV